MSSLLLAVFNPPPGQNAIWAEYQQLVHEQHHSESSRIRAMDTEYAAKFSQVRSDDTLKPEQRDSALAILLAEYEAKHGALVQLFNVERELQFGTADQVTERQYRAFVFKKARHGNLAALRELSKLIGVDDTPAMVL